MVQMAPFPNGVTVSPHGRKHQSPHNQRPSNVKMQVPGRLIRLPLTAYLNFRAVLITMLSVFLSPIIVRPDSVPLPGVYYLFSLSSSSCYSKRTQVTLHRLHFFLSFLLYFPFFFTHFFMIHFG